MQTNIKLQINEKMNNIIRNLWWSSILRVYYKGIRKSMKRSEVFFCSRFLRELVHILRKVRIYYKSTRFTRVYLCMSCVRLLYLIHQYPFHTCILVHVLRKAAVFNTPVPVSYAYTCACLAEGSLIYYFEWEPASRITTKPFN